MKLKIFTIVSLFYCLIVTNSLFGYYVPIPNTIYPIIPFVTSFMLYPKSFFNKSFLAFIIYAFVLIFYFAFGIGIHTIGYGNSDFDRLLIELALILPSLSIINVVFYLRDWKLLRLLTIVSLASIVFTFAYILPLIIYDKNLLRLAGGTINMGSGEEVLTLTKSGLPSYSLLHAYGIIAPIFIGFAFSKKMWFLLTSLLLFIIIRSSITTVLITVFFSFILLIISKAKIKSRLFLYIIFGALILLYLLDFFPYIFTSLASLFSDTAYESKFYEISNLFQYGNVGSNITVRSNLYSKSFNSFIYNPLIGNKHIGYHSTLLDHLGGTGLIGFIPYSLISYFQYHQAKKYLLKTDFNLYNLSWFVAIVLLSSKGIFGIEGFFFLFILVPGLLLMNKQYKSRHNKNIYVN